MAKICVKQRPFKNAQIRLFFKFFFLFLFFLFLFLFFPFFFFFFFFCFICQPTLMLFKRLVTVRQFKSVLTGANPFTNPFLSF
jgi:hypothetical protein